MRSFSGMCEITGVSVISILTLKAFHMQKRLPEISTSHPLTLLLHNSLLICNYLHVWFLRVCVCVYFVVVIYGLSIPLMDMKLLNMFSQSSHSDGLNKDAGSGEEELRSGCSCCIGCLLSSGKGLNEQRERESRRKQEGGRENWGRRWVLLLGDRECPLVASADNSTSASALLLGEQSTGRAEGPSCWAKNGTLE